MTATSREGFTAAECAWLDQAKARWQPLTEPQASLLRRTLASTAEAGAA